MQEHPEDLEKIEKLKDLIAWQVRTAVRVGFAERVSRRHRVVFCRVAVALAFCVACHTHCHYWPSSRRRRRLTTTVTAFRLSISALLWVVRFLSAMFFVVMIIYLLAVL